MVELGISTFGETTELEGTGQTYSHAERIRQLVAEIELADKVGLDVYGIGEHHRADFSVSAPEIVLAAGAVNTKKIRLTSAVSILSSMDPIRLFQQYATIDALSNGRAEIMAGRGSFTESFPLFGYDLKDYEALFDEKIDLLQLVNEKTKLDWQGRLTQTISGKEVNLWQRSLSSSSSGQITLVDSDRWLCRINSEDCSGRPTDCLCYYWW